MIFFIWELSPPSFLKINFDGTVLNISKLGDASFIIRSFNGAFVVIGGAQLVETIVPMTELHTA